MKKMFKGSLILALTLLGSFSVKADNLLYIVDTSYKLGIIDLTTDTVSVIGNTKTALHDIGFTSNGNLYGVTQNALYSLSLTTGSASLINSFPSTIGLNNIDGLVGDGTGLLASSGSTKGIYAIDVSPYSATALMGASNGMSFGDITFGPAGSSGPLYEALTTGYLDKISISGTTITSSLVGNMGLDFNGLATVGGVTYGITGTQIYSINLTDGAVSKVFNYSGHGLGNDAGAAAKTLLSVPEPSNLALLMAGIACLAFYQSRKRANA